MVSGAGRAAAPCRRRSGGPCRPVALAPRRPPDKSSSNPGRRESAAPAWLEQRPATLRRIFSPSLCRARAATSRRSPWRGEPEAPCPTKAQARRRTSPSRGSASASSRRCSRSASRAKTAERMAEQLSDLPPAGYRWHAVAEVLRRPESTVLAAAATSHRGCADAGRRKRSAIEAVPIHPARTDTKVGATAFCPDHLLVATSAARRRAARGEQATALLAAHSGSFPKSPAEACARPKAGLSGPGATVLHQRSSVILAVVVALRSMETRALIQLAPARVVAVCRVAAISAQWLTRPPAARCA
jgi:hypothetical protein